MGHIYMIRNKINEKIYIGQTTRPIEVRLEEHRTGKNSGCVAIYNAVKKYGWENLEKDWYECPNEDLNFDEEILVREMGTLSPNGYNLKEGGGSRGRDSEETKQKKREAHLGKTHNEETKLKQRESSLGKPKSDEHIRNMRKPKSEKSKQKNRETHLGDNNHNSKRVYQYDLEGNLLGSFASAGEAGRHLEKDGSNINACARGAQGYKTAHGFKWTRIKIIT